MSKRRKSQHPKKQAVKPISKITSPQPGEKHLESIVRKTVTQMRSEIFAGPLPHPDILIKYNQAVPDAAERILKMAEKQSNHREGLENRVIDSDIIIRKRGQNFAFVLALIILLGGFGLIAIDKDILGMGSIIGAAVSLIGLFIYGAKQRKKERIQKYGAAFGKNNQAK